MEEDQVRGFGLDEEHTYREGVARLRDILGVARVAMLTTADETGALKSRPMVVQSVDDEGDAWLIADESSAKVHAVRREWHVNLAWLRPVRGRWVSASGRATVVHDPTKLRDLWEPSLQSWFPEGVDDPRLCLLKVRLDEAVVWDAPIGNLMQMKRLAERLLQRGGRQGESGREVIVLRTRQAGIGDTAGILGTAGGSMGVAPRLPFEASPRGLNPGAAPEARSTSNPTPATSARSAPTPGRAGKEAPAAKAKSGTAAKGGATARTGPAAKADTGMKPGPTAKTGTTAKPAANAPTKPTANAPTKPMANAPTKPATTKPTAKDTAPKATTTKATTTKPATKAAPAKPAATKPAATKATATKPATTKPGEAVGGRKGR